MGEDLIPFFGDVKDTMQGIIKVVGVGGGGCNAVRNMQDPSVSPWFILDNESDTLTFSIFQFKSTDLRCFPPQ